MDYHTGSGQIIYNPPRPGVTYRGSEGWCVLNVDKEITRYYRWWLSFHQHIHIQPPSWDAHISIVRGERLDNQFQHLWKKYHKVSISFKYPHGHIRVGESQRTDYRAHLAVKGNYYFIDVDCPELFEIRKELGLPCNFKTFHLTIGRTYEYTSRYTTKVANKKIRNSIII